VIRQCPSIHLLGWMLLSVGLAGAQDPGPGAGHYTEKELETLKRVYQEAVAKPVAQFESLSQPAFCSDYGPRYSSWRIGPFVLDASLTFTKTRLFEDPLNIGWKSTVIGNPTLIERDGRLHMFYRGYPRKESQSTRIGHAVFTERAGWEDLSGPPILYSTEPDEINSVEDPKLYQHGDTYYLFYNAVWTPDPEFSEQIRRGYRDWGVFVVTKLAVSRDLMCFEKKGPVVPYSISRGWSKGAVIPRDPEGRAVRVNGKFLMFLSEGCGDQQYIGYSDDLVDWEFRQQTFLELPAEMGRIAEVACCVAEFEPTGKHLVLDVFYRDRQQQYRAVQALYHVGNVTQPLAIEQGGSLAWGGLLKYRGAWIVAQGWDSPKDRQELYFYRFSGSPAVELGR
jgi:hypothetical protein